MSYQTLRRDEALTRALCGPIISSTRGVGAAQAGQFKTSREMPISIHSYLKGAVFEPGDIDAIASAFDNTCRTLQVAPGADIVREVIAKHVMEFARRGERDPNKLQAEVVKALKLDPRR